MQRLAALFLILIALPSAAQTPPPVNNNIIIPNTSVDPSPVPAILPCPAAEPPVFGLDIMFGQQTGLRVDGALWRADGGSLRLEGFYGLTATKFGSAESAGAGLRWQTRRTGGDSCHAVVFGPGCDVLFHLSEGHAIFLAPTVELAWHRTIGNSAGWVLGLNAGIGIGLSGDDTDRDNVAGRITPLISGFTGFRY